MTLQVIEHVLLHSYEAAFANLFCSPLSARSGYRIQVDPDGNATRAIYYMEQELSKFDPSKPANYNRCE